MKLLLLPIAMGILYLFCWLLGEVAPALANFVEQWFLLEQYSSELLPTWLAIIIDLVTPVVVYKMVGVIFSALGWYDSTIMHFVNLILTAGISVGISLLIRWVIEYWWIALIILGIFIIAIFAFAIKNKYSNNN